MKNMLILENDRFLRDLLTQYFNDSKKYTVVSSLDNSKDILEICFNKRVDVGLLDICIEEDSRGGIRVGKKIKKYYPRIKVILMTGVPELSYIQEAREAKVDSFIYKHNTIEDLFDAVDKTMKGKNIWPEFNKMENNSLSFLLSPREEEVARMICCECLTRAEIAERLNIQPGTVKTITSRILVKTNVKNIRQLMALMLSSQYLKPENLE